MQNYSTSNTNQSNTKPTPTPVSPASDDSKDEPEVINNTSSSYSTSSSQSVPKPGLSIEEKKAELDAYVKEKVNVEEFEPGIYRATTDISKYIIEYDKNKCIGAASCADIAANTFFMNEENRAEIRTDVDNHDEDDLILAAAQSCPVFAIKIIDKASNEVLFPIE